MLCGTPGNPLAGANNALTNRQMIQDRPFQQVFVVPLSLHRPPSTGAIFNRKFLIQRYFYARMRPRRTPRHAHRKRFLPPVFKAGI